jgi:3-deoxy-D-manno-octulosonate 8-phosphate phosphatase (KDO 8-P phosphatase)
LKSISSKKLEQFTKIKALVFDWDGVFHSGYKNHLSESTFSEADSMGVNMLRLGYYLHSGEIPKTIIISGENNKTAHFLAQREHFDAVFSKAKDKKVLLQFLDKEYNIKPAEVLFVFDDILDLSLAQFCGIRFLVKRTASHLLESFITENEFTDFITTCDGGNHAIREICEFTLQKLNFFEKTLNTRIEFSTEYIDYLSKRKNIQTKLIEIS